jgi:hypothetical protein
VHTGSVTVQRPGDYAVGSDDGRRIEVGRLVIRRDLDSVTNAALARQRKSHAGIR